MTLTCPMCNKEYSKKMSLLTFAIKNNTQTGLSCSRYCGAKRRFTLHPEVYAAGGMKQRGRIATGPRGRGVPREPHTEEHRKHLSEVAKARNLQPTQRGGNGTGLTPAEKMIASVMETLGFVWNHAVPLGIREEGYPTNYKLDFAHPTLKVGLEVDGANHRQTERKIQDKKKVDKLKEFGWKVFRVQNSQILSGSGILKLEDVRTILPEEFWSTIAKQ